jgi:hypothetical protein
MSKREAAWLWNRVHGVDDDTVAHRVMNKGISRDETFGKDLHSDEDIERELLRLVTRAASDMRGDGLTARTVAVRLRDFDFTTRATQRTLPEPVVSDRAILRVAHELLRKLREGRRVPARLVGVRLSGLTKAADVSNRPDWTRGNGAGPGPRAGNRSRPWEIRAEKHSARRNQRATLSLNRTAYRSPSAAPQPARAA